MYVSIRICCKSTTEEGRTQVDRDAREPGNKKKIKTLLAFKGIWTQINVEVSNDNILHHNVAKATEASTNTLLRVPAVEKTWSSFNIISVITP